MNQYHGALSRALLKLSIGLATALAVGLALVAVPTSSATAASVSSSVSTSAHASVATTSVVAKKTKKAKKKHRLTRGEVAVRIARGRHGKPYRYGATGPNSFDCSGLTRYVYKRLHVNLPHNSAAQVSRTYRIKHPRPGDLVFFYGSGGVYHVAIYAGHHSVWHAPYPGSVVKKERIWTHDYFIRRVKKH